MVEHALERQQRSIRRPEPEPPATDTRSRPFAPQNVLALQRSIGNAAVGRALGRERARRCVAREEGYPDVPKKTSPHRSNWRVFVNEQYGLMKKKLLPGIQGWQVDQQYGTIYQDTLGFADQLDATGATNTPTVDPLTVDVTQLRMVAPPELEGRLNFLWSEMRKFGAASTPEVRVPKWGPLATGGMGTWVVADYTANSTMAAGSSASGTTTALPWLDGVLDHRGYDLRENKTIYVRGHLLNDHLGGPSVPYNLVPLTGEATSSSANANKTHEGSVESLAKKAVERLYGQRDNPGRSPSPFDITKVNYEVSALWSPGTRGGTTAVADGAAELEGVLEEIQDMHPNVDMARLTVEHVRDWIPDAEYDAVWMDCIKHPIDAVVPLERRQNVRAQDALAAMKDNARLWAYEDAVVPDRIFCGVTVEYARSAPDQHTQYVENTLPSHADAPYIRTNLPAVGPSATSVFGTAREGYPEVPAKTKGHTSNWRQFVNTQYGLMKTRLTDANVPGWQVDNAFRVRLQGALDLAADLDSKSSMQAATLDPFAVDVYGQSMQAPQALQDRLNAMWAVVRSQSGVQTTNLPDVLVPRWGPLVTGGMGSWVHAVYTRNGTLASGSAASGTKTALPWLDDMLDHRGFDLRNNKTIYVRGHLLNDHLGGPSLPYNLVPLTGEATASSANANKTHEGSVESMAKKAVERLYELRDNPQWSPGRRELTQVEYSVHCQWAGGTRNGTTRVAAGAREFEHLLDFIRKNQPFTNMAKLTVAHARAAISPQAYGTVWTDTIKDAMDAVVPEDRRQQVYAADALRLMQRNAALWAYEDQVVPSSLYCLVKRHYSDSSSDETPQVVQNTLPSQPHAPYVKQ